MKTLLMFFLFLPYFLIGQHFTKLEKAFEIQEKDLIPEGIAYDPSSNAFYVGSIYKNKIIKITEAGKVTDFVPEGAYGSWAYLGLKVNENTGELWACRSEMTNTKDSTGFSGIFRYNLKTGVLKKKYISKDAGHLFNDLTFHEGDTYFTDSEEGSIYRIDRAQDSLKIFIGAGSFIYPNGITLHPDGSGLIVSTARGLQKVNLKTKEITPLIHPGYFIIGVDGLYSYKNSLIGLCNIIKPEAVNQYVFNARADTIESVNTLACAHPDFYNATTGAIKNGWFYFIANSFVSQLKEDGHLKDEKSLRNLLIYRVKLDNN